MAAKSKTYNRNIAFPFQGRDAGEATKYFDLMRCWRLPVAGMYVEYFGGFVVVVIGRVLCNELATPESYLPKILWSV